MSRLGPFNRNRSVVARPRWLLLVTAGTLLFLMLPMIVVALFSLNAGESLSHLDGFSLRWYRSLIENPKIHESLRASLIIAFTSMSVALVLGTGLAFAFTRGRNRITSFAQGTTLTTLVTPEIATAIGLLTLVSTIGIPLSSTTIVVGHITFSLVYVSIVVGSRLRTLNPEVEEAARDLGATPRETFRYVTVPHLTPALAGSALLVFVLSFDDFVTSLFLSGTEVSPLPLRIYGMLRFGLTPEVNAIGTSMMVVSVSIGLLGFWVAMRRGSQKT